MIFVTVIWIIFICVPTEWIVHIMSLCNLQLKYQGELVLNQMMLKKDVAACEVLVKDFMALGDMDAWEERIIILMEIEAKLKDCHDRAELFASREEVPTYLFTFIIQESIDHIEELEEDGLEEVLHITET